MLPLLWSNEHTACSRSQESIVNLVLLKFLFWNLCFTSECSILLIHHYFRSCYTEDLNILSKACSDCVSRKAGNASTDGNGGRIAREKRNATHRKVQRKRPSRKWVREEGSLFVALLRRGKTKTSRDTGDGKRKLLFCYESSGALYALTVRGEEVHEEDEEF